MRLPVRAQPLEEPAALVDVEPLPERRCIAADRRDDLAPVDGGGCLVSHLAPKSAEHADRGVGPRLEVGGRVEMRRRHRRDAVRLRQEPAARHRVDAATVVEVAEGERDVAHRQPGTEQQHVFPTVQLERVGRPRIAGIAKARGDLVSLDPWVGRREVADRKHDLVDARHAPVRERQPRRPWHPRRSRRRRRRPGPAGDRRRGAPRRAAPRGTRRTSGAGRRSHRSATGRSPGRSGGSRRDRPRTRSSAPPARSTCDCRRSSSTRRRRSAARLAR